MRIVVFLSRIVMYHRVVVVGTGIIGKKLLSILFERNFKLEKLDVLSSHNVKEVSFGNEKLETTLIKKYDFSKADIVFFASGSQVSSSYVKKAASHAVVIDLSSYFRMDEKVPLIIPEVNPYKILDYKKGNIVSSPNCTVTPIAMALAPLNKINPIKRIVVSTYQSVSGAGIKGMDELYNQTKSSFMGEELESEIFPKKISFNIIPHIDIPTDTGESREEMKIRKELNKILDSKIQISATCVRIPIFVGHSASINVEFEKNITPEEARERLQKSPGISLRDNTEKEEYYTPLDCVTLEQVLISRIRNEVGKKNTLNLWVISDNLVKGGALNAVQIAELLLERMEKN